MYGRDEGKRPQVYKAFLEPIMSAAKTHILILETANFIYIINQQVI